MAADRRLVTARRRAGQGPGRPQSGNVRDGALDEIHQRRKRHTGGSGDALSLAEHGHEMIRSHDGRGVVAPTIRIVDGKAPATQGIDDHFDHRVAGGREPGPVEPLCADLRVRQRHQRVKGGSTVVVRQHVEAQRSRKMQHDGIGARQCRRDRSDLVIGGCDNDDVALAADLRVIVGPTKETTRPAGCAKRPGQ